MDDEFSGVDICQSCGSRRYHVEDGITFCENGHNQEGGPEVGDDDADYGTQGKIVRLKVEKRARITKVFRGKKAYKLFLEAYQFIIWKQCYALVHQKGLPSELWIVVRDLWTLRLSKQLRKVEEPNKNVEDRKDFSSSAQDSGEDTDVDNISHDGDESSRKAGDSPTLVQTIALCYLGILLLRLPIPLVSLYRWIREEDIVYLRAIRHVPQDMKDKLPGPYHEALDTPFTLTCDDLQAAVFLLARLYDKAFGMSLSPINWTILLFENVKDLGLPLETYAAAKSLNQIVAFDFRFDVASSRRKATSLPEAQLMSVVIVAVKLLYPFDGDTLKRYPRSINEPGAQRIDWAQWIEATSRFDNRSEDLRGLKRGAEVEIKDTDIMNLSEKQLDEYMDWYQQTWTSSKPNDEYVNKNILGLFPLKTLPDQDGRANVETEREAAIQAKLRDTQASMKVRRHISDEEAEEKSIEVSRPGSHYAIFRSVQDLEGQPAARAFYSAAAEIACLSLETMVMAVLQTERRITMWRNAKRRADHFGDDVDLDAERRNERIEKVASDLGLTGELMSEGSARAGEDEQSGSDMDMLG